MKHLIIIGVGGLAREVFSYAHEAIGYGEEWDIKGFLDGDTKLDESEYTKLLAPLLGNITDYVIEEGDVFVCAIAAPVIKQKICKMMLEKKAKFVNIISKQAYIAQNAKLGKGIIIGPFCFVSCDTYIGDFTFFNVRCSIGHDVNIGAYSSLMGHVNVGGNCVIETGTYWGTAAVALPHSKIKSYSTVGACSLVLKKVKEKDTVFGVPATSIL